MSRATKDGAWVSLSKVTQVHCTKCGIVKTAKYPTNDREDDDLIREHVAEHGGRG